MHHCFPNILNMRVTPLRTFQKRKFIHVCSILWRAFMVSSQSNVFLIPSYSLHVVQCLPVNSFCTVFFLGGGLGGEREIGLQELAQLKATAEADCSIYTWLEADGALPSWV